MADNDMKDERRVVALVRDLMFASRVRGAAPEAVIVRSGAAVGEAVGPDTRLVIIELEAPGSEEAVADAVREAPSARVVAFGPHVMEDVLASARSAGAEVLTRGAFVKRLSGLVESARSG